MVGQNLTWSAWTARSTRAEPDEVRPMSPAQPYQTAPDERETYTGGMGTGAVFGGQGRKEREREMER